MARLPLPGSDGNNWGTLLNDFVQQSLASDGTLEINTTNAYTGLTNTNLATATRPGLIKVAGDLSNTYSLPRVSGLQGHAVDSATPSDGNVLTWSDSAGKWQPATPSSGGGGGGSVSGDLDGGSATTVFGGITAIDCGAAV